jgi:hypothetical protein
MTVRYLAEGAGARSILKVELLNLKGTDAAEELSLIVR